MRSRKVDTPVKLNLADFKGIFLRTPLLLMADEANMLAVWDQYTAAIQLGTLDVYLVKGHLRFVAPE